MKLFDAGGKIEVDGQIRNVSWFTTASRTGYNYPELVENWNKLSQDQRKIMREIVDEFFVFSEIDILKRNFQYNNVSLVVVDQPLPVRFIDDEGRRSASRKNFLRGKAPNLRFFKLPRHLGKDLKIEIYGMYFVPSRQSNRLIL